MVLTAYAAKKEIIDGIRPYRFVQIIAGQLIRQTKGSFYLVVGATHSASSWSEYKLAALDMFFSFQYLGMRVFLPTFNIRRDKCRILISHLADFVNH
jgi:hypothetical protein